MRSADDHLQLILSLLKPRFPAEVPLARALGLITAGEVKAVGNIPPFDNSAMDGYAVRGADLARASALSPVTLAVVGQAAAGHLATGDVAPGTAVRIMTGAPMAVGADAVVPQELVTRAGDQVTFTAPVADGANVRRAGEDAKPGDLVVAAGVELTARHLAAAASAGAGTVEVWPAPRVGYLITGDELVAPGEPLRPGQIHESNGTYVAAALTRLGAVPVDLGRVGDDADAVARAVEQAAVDLIVTTGGASVGDHDPAKEALSSRGVEFTNVAMQPGKPQGAGRVGGTPVVCLPGNPVAVAVCVEAFVGPAVRALRGVPEPEWVPMTAAVAWTCPPGREQFMPVTLEGNAAFPGNAVRPATAGGSGSHLIARLSVAQALARVPAHVDAVAPGDTVLVRRFTV